jgi:hypothetical protein
MSTTTGSISKFAAAFMVCHNQESWPRNSLPSVWHSRATTNVNAHPVSGDTSGDPYMFTLIVDDFGVEYVGEEHAIHLRDTIKEHYDLTKNWKGDLYSGINLD